MNKLGPYFLRTTLVFATLGAAGACAPQNATLTEGAYTAMLSRNTSSVFVGDQVQVDEIAATGTVNVVDCLSYENESQRTEGALPICNDGLGILVPRSNGGTALKHETWLDRDVFSVASEPLDAWRGEAVMTSEGDLQLAFHHRLPGNDFRFVMVLDPNFQPVRCQEDESGALSLDPIDGDWVGGWSRALNEANYEGGDVEFPGGSHEGTLFALNSQSLQYNPTADARESWVLPPTMEAGFATARWGPEEMALIASRYADPAYYLSETDDGPGSKAFFVDLDDEEYAGDNFEADIRSNDDFIDMMKHVERVADETVEELAVIGVPDPELHKPVVPSNAWRRPDGTIAGFDGWGELHYNWVRLDQTREEIAVGADLSGEFALWFYGSDSQSHLIVRGSFEVDGVKKDRWTTRNVQQEKLEENNTNLCGTQYGDGE